MLEFLTSNPLWRLSVASLKMYFRDFTAVFFSILFPIIFLVVFGFVGQSDSLRVDIAYWNESTTPTSIQFDEAFNQFVVDSSVTEEENEGAIFKLNSDIQAKTDEGDFDGALQLAKEKMSESELSAAVVVPEDFGKEGGGEITVMSDASNTEFAGVVENVVAQIVDGFNKQAVMAELGGEIPEPFTLKSETIKSSDLGGIDYLVPGIIAFSVMSLGVFSVSQGFISLKSSGALRRLHVAPLNPVTFLTAQSITRLIMTALNVIVMVLVGIVLFDFSIRGNLTEFTLFAVIGSIMFLGMGFAIAGWARDENQAAPVSNIIFFPMMFLSGTFFPRELFPEWLKPITDFMPLTYVGDGLREIANNGAHIWDLGPELAGIAVWTVLIYWLAVKIFRWE